jgi:hypothetical protein
MKNAVTIAGIETVRDKDGKVKKLSVTFINNCLTWMADHRTTHTTKLIDSRDFINLSCPMDGLWDALAAAYGDKGIDYLYISMHSDWEGLYIFSKIRKELPEYDRYITPDRSWEKIKFNPGAVIELSGCQTAGMDGKRIPNTIAQIIANKSGVKVLGFTVRSSQKRRKDGGYYQKPEKGGYVELLPEGVDSIEGKNG